MNDIKYKNLTIHEFDKAAEKFEDNDPSVYNICRNDYPDIVAELVKEPFSSILDAGCGTGALLTLFHNDYPNVNYTGIDLSSKMIEVAKRKNLSNVIFIHGDCENLPFDACEFDVVICSQSFHHYPNPDNFIASVQRVLKPGGRLILRDMTAKQPLLWFINYIELPLINLLLKKGDVRAYGKKDIHEFCVNNGLVLELFQQRKGFRLHCVCRKAETN